MTAHTPAHTPAPTIYSDGLSLYLEWPTYALRFPFTEGGLAKALKHIPQLAPKLGYLTGGSNLLPPVAKVARVTSRKREAAQAPEEVRSAIKDLIRGMKEH